MCVTSFMAIQPHSIFGGFIATSGGWVLYVCKELIAFNVALVSLPVPVWWDTAQAGADFPPTSGSDHFFVAGTRKFQHMPEVRNKEGQAVQGCDDYDDDRFCIVLYSALEQTHCARMWVYMTD